jgi:glycosyltransferase involved in cell wall biosynthesis
MHIVTVTWKFPDPTEPFVVSKILGLVERGHVCTVVTDEVVTVADPDLRSRLGDRVSITTSLTPLRHADLVHFEHAGVARKYRHLLPGIRAPKVVTSHGSDVRVETIGQARVEQGLADVFSAVDRVHCVSHELAEHCLRLGARPDQLFIAPAGVDLGLFAPHRRRPRPEGLALPLVSIGRLDWVKGYEYALHAVHLLREAGLRVSYTIVGLDEGAGPSMRLAIRDFGLEDVVSLTGHLSPSAVRDALAAADIFVLSSVSEGSSTATMEAMAMGLPVVVTDVGGNREIVRDGVHGFVVPPRSPEALAGAVAALGSDETRRQFGEKAAIDARDFDAATQLDRLVDLYTALTGVEPHPASPADGDLVSVVIVAHNAAGTIEDQLRALSLQVYEGSWEVVVVDNASTDDTAATALSWSARLLAIRVVGAPERPSIPYARNIGVRAARGPRIVMCDADDVVAPGWLAELARALETEPIVCGVLERSQLLPAHVDAGAGLDTEALHAENYRMRVLTGNLGFRRAVFDRLGGFDEGLARGEDLDFGWRAIDAGYEPRSVSGAVVHYRSQWRTGAVIRRGFADGQAGPALYLRHRVSGMERPQPHEVKARYTHLASGLLHEVWSPRRRVEWAYDAGFCTGRLLASLRHRIWFP